MTDLLNALQDMTLPMSAEDTKSPFRCLLYGDYGAGKTWLSGQIGKAISGKQLFVTTDDNWVVLNKDLDVWNSVYRVPYEGFTQMELIAAAHTAGIEPYVQAKTLTWDAVSTGLQITLRNLVDLKKFPKQQMDPEIEGFAHYRMIRNMLRKTILELHKSKLNIIYTAHIRDPLGSEQGDTKFATRANMPEASYSVLAEQVQAIGWVYKEKKGGKRLVQFEGTVREAAKSQLPTIEEATYSVEEIPELVRKWTE